MKNIMRHITINSLAAMLLLVTAAESDAGFKKFRFGSDRARDMIVATDGSFTVVGQFTGSLEGEIAIGHAKVHVSDRAAIYRTGDGSEPIGTFVVGANVYLGGKMENGMPVANFIVVRPKPIAPSQAKETSRFYVPSPSNPDVGSYDFSDGYEE